MKMQRHGKKEMECLQPLTKESIVLNKDVLLHASVFYKGLLHASHCTWVSAHYLWSNSRTIRTNQNLIFWWGFDSPYTPNPSLLFTLNHGVCHDYEQQNPHKLVKFWLYSSPTRTVPRLIFFFFVLSFSELLAGKFSNLFLYTAKESTSWMSHHILSTWREPTFSSCHASLTPFLFKTLPVRWAVTQARKNDSLISSPFKFLMR